MSLVIVSATRCSEQEFWETSPLGQSLTRLAVDPRISSMIAFANQIGLPLVYNHCLSLMQGDPMAVFIHDDVWIEDFALYEHLQSGLQVFDMVGVVGNKRRFPGQPAWAFLDSQWNWDEDANLSGLIGHGDYPFAPVDRFGPSPSECELLDGFFWVFSGPHLRNLDSALTSVSPSTFMTWISAGKCVKLVCGSAPGPFASPIRALVATKARVGGPAMAIIWPSGVSNSLRSDGPSFRAVSRAPISSLPNPLMFCPLRAHLTRSRGVRLC